MYIEVILTRILDLYDYSYQINYAGIYFQVDSLYFQTKIRIWQIFIPAQILYLSEKILNKIRLQRQLKQNFERLNNVL